MPRENGTERRRTLVVVGNGMVGHRFCERMLLHDVARRWRIVVLGEETRPAYDRVHLSEFFAGRTADDLQLADATWYAANGITLRLGDKRETHTVVLVPLKSSAKAAGTPAAPEASDPALIAAAPPLRARRRRRRAVRPSQRGCARSSCPTLPALRRATTCSRCKARSA